MSWIVMWNLSRIFQKQFQNEKLNKQHKSFFRKIFHFLSFSRNENQVKDEKHFQSVMKNIPALCSLFSLVAKIVKNTSFIFNAATFMTQYPLMVQVKIEWKLENFCERQKLINILQSLQNAFYRILWIKRQWCN